MVLFEKSTEKGGGGNTYTQVSDKKDALKQTVRIHLLSHSCINNVYSL